MYDSGVLDVVVADAGVLVNVSREVGKLVELPATGCGELDDVTAGFPNVVDENEGDVGYAVDATGAAPPLHDEDDNVVVLPAGDGGVVTLVEAGAGTG